MPITLLKLVLYFSKLNNSLKFFVKSKDDFKYMYHFGGTNNLLEKLFIEFSLAVINGEFLVFFDFN